MKYSKYAGIGKKVSAFGLGSWQFGGDFWWGSQNDGDSMGVLSFAVEHGINLIDTAPFYGSGHSEEVVGKFLEGTGIRKNIVLATKLGLDPESKGFHNLKKDRMLRELDDSLRRLRTDYLDLYQIHWPDPAVPVAESANVMRGFFEQGLIKAVGVSNYTVPMLREFMDNCPLHSLQMPYNMFGRGIEDEIVPFCEKNGVSIITYSPLCGAVLTGKYFFGGVKIPSDTVRKNLKELKEPFWGENKKFLAAVKRIADRYDKTLPQFVLNWTVNRKGINCVLIGARNRRQLEENLGALDWKISEKDLTSVGKLLEQRDSNLSAAGS